MTESVLDRIGRLDMVLLKASSATIALETWCEQSGLGVPPVRLRVQVEHKEDAPLPAIAAGIFGAGESLRYRHVTMFCGDLAVAHAGNWYSPERLTPDMTRKLDTTTVPFGRVVGPFSISRETLENIRLWNNDSPPPPSAPVIRNTAIVKRADFAPVSVVEETFMGVLLNF
ncbi:hypothetical protein [Acetobacter sp.]|jgi:chorismate-pyruvate lyase|uniref:hypothetical protein n=1 Tax=Acetobacter sp. TaxID=440 RepID=UPI0025C4DC9F|nr:hypothetical protein [Acetobacter sp.]MCH4090939.1 hypothetical protein [Acetobacter sp.]MCI1300780.1 hypothetical protein [Acetobacter sp.]MCI1317115.1 hypothetical protein [Acetobacter sp.]